MQIPTYFFKSLESIYYFRMRVSTDLRSIFNRTELKKSLRTKSKTVALRRCRQYVVAAEQVFESLRLSHFKAELTGTSPTDQLLDLTALKQLDSPPTIRGREKELWNKVFKAADSATSYNDSHPTPDITPILAPALPSSPIPPVQQVSQRIPLSELIRLYITEVINQRGQIIARGIEKNLLRFMEIVTDKPIDLYSVEDKLRYRDVLQLMPKCINRKEYQGMSIDDIVKMERPAEELLSIKTVNMRLIEIATLFNWAVNRISKIYNSAKGCNYKFFNTSYIATETMATRTRCYVLDGIDEDGKPATKLSRGGIQTHADGPKTPGDRDERVIEFMRAASVGGFLKESWLDFPKMQSRGGIPPRKEKTIARCSMSYMALYKSQHNAYIS